MINEDLDDYEFTPATNSNLAAIFGSAMVLPDDDNLVYKAPKQPKIIQAEQKTDPKSDSAVICAKVVNVWKLKTTRYIALGQHMIALIGAQTLNAYEIILYKDKRNIIARSKVFSGFALIQQDNDFVSFYDDYKQNWMIRFNNSNDFALFSSEMRKLGATFTSNQTQSTQNQVTDAKKTDKKGTCDGSDVLSVEESVENRTKAEILSRITKMGQLMLPNSSKTQNTSNSCDELEIANVCERVMDNSKSTTIIQMSSHDPNIAPPVVSTLAANYDPLNLFLLENRTCNTEVRMNISQVSTKLDQILHIIQPGKMPQQCHGNCDHKTKIKVLELRIENLQNELRKSEEKCLQMQQQEIVQGDNRGIQSHISNPELICDNRVQALTDEIDCLSQTIKRQNDEMHECKKMIEDNNEKMFNQQIEIDKLNEKRIIDAESFQRLNEQRTLLCGEARNVFVDDIKQCMNIMFNNIIGNFSDNREYSPAEIQPVVTQNIKHGTFKLIKKFEDVFKNNSN